MKPCIIVPVYNHEEALPRMLAKLKVYGLPCLLIDDGSSTVCTQVLTDCTRLESKLKRPKNGGKGTATLDGLKETVRPGFTHALQIDAE